MLKSDEHDVFGDGTVVIRGGPRHTPGHQVLYVKLPDTGGVLLSGDLYDYPEKRTLDRVPSFELNQQQTGLTKVNIERFLKQMDAQLWIQHDFRANATLKKAPDYHE